MLLATLFVCWALGVHTALDGYATIRILGDPFAADGLQIPSVMRDALVQSILANSSIVLPVAVAQILLGGLLVVVSIGLLARARVSVNLGLQVLAVNGLVFMIGYFVAGPIRDALVSALMKLPEIQAAGASADPGNFYWAFRLRLAAQLAALGFAAWVITRPRSRKVLTPRAPSEEET